MASLRRGLPRTPGGEPWPPAGLTVDDAVAAVVTAEDAVTQTADARALAAEDAATSAASVATAPDVAPSAPAAPAEASVVSPSASSVSAPAEAASVSSASLRRGLPRVAGGEPWPPAGTMTAAAPAASADVIASSAAPESTAPASAPVAATPVATASAPAAPSTVSAVASDVPVRRGLPRTAGGDGWPPAGTRPLVAAPAEEAPPAAGVVATDVPSAEAVVAAPDAASVPVHAGRDVSTPLPVPRGVTPGRYAFEHPQPVEPVRVGRFTPAQWGGIATFGALALIVAAFLAVMLTRWILSLEGPADFIRTYPGEYDLPDGSAPGFPAWARWQHFFNVFLMVLIIRSGWQVRTQQRPEAFFTARWSKDQKKKISLNLWFHQSLDILWLVNGIIFVVLLFASGHWVRIVPTSWEVFPNALSSVLQYISLDWPTEHGWVNYNSIQQLMYFTVVFLAAPLAAITGVRMSGMWPAKATTLNKIYPVEVARAIHFPVMLFFVIFIVIHVALVFATGALRNLNHMFAGTDLVNWTGFWIFVAAMAVIVVAVAASRTLVLAPIAKLFGKVSQR